MAIIQRASDMQDLYANDTDPWKNGERGLYNKLMKQLVEKINALEDFAPHQSYTWCDIGAGGGNVMRGIRHNQGEKTIYFRGVDLSPAAVEALKQSDEFGQDFTQMDLEEYVHDDKNPPPWHNCSVISWIEVLYYFGDKRPWKVSFNEFWKGVTPGSIVVVADSLIPYQYRDYLKKNAAEMGAELIEEYTDLTEAVSTETRENGSKWTRWLKVRVYRKL